jgi:hypothetical protein
MHHHQRFLHRRLLLSACAVILSCAAIGGCGTTGTSNTARTATEQLLISDAIDRAVESIKFNKLAGQSVFFDERHLYEVVDDGYLISSLRQHLLASGCILKDKREDATYVVEPRAGAVGTDHDDLLFGIPAINTQQLTLLSGVPSSLPEIPFIKRRHQRGIAKIAVFAYSRETGAPVWQSGIATDESSSNDIWFFGAGPFKRGSIHKGTSYASQKDYLLQGIGPSDQPEDQVVSIGQEAVFGRRSPGSIGAPKIPYLAAAPRPIAEPHSPPAVNPGAHAVGPPIFGPPAAGPQQQAPPAPVNGDVQSSAGS